MKRGKGSGFGKGGGTGKGKPTERTKPPFRIPDGYSDLRLANNLVFQENAERTLNAMGITDKVKHEQVRRVFGFINQLFHDAITNYLKIEIQSCVERGIDPLDEQVKKMLERKIIRKLVHDEKFGQLIGRGLRGVLGEETGRFLDEYKRLMNK